MLAQSQFYGEKNTNDTCNRRRVHLLTTNQSIESTTNKHSAEMVRQIDLEKDSGCVEIQRKVLESDLEGIVRAYPRSEWFRKGDSSFI